MLLQVAQVVAAHGLMEWTHVEDWISGFLLDVYHLSLVDVVTHGRHFLLSRLLSAEWCDGNRFGRHFDHHQVADAMTRAAALNDWAAIELLWKYAPWIPLAECAFEANHPLLAAAQAGHELLVEWFCEPARGLVCLERMLPLASRRGQLQLVQILLRQLMECDAVVNKQAIVHDTTCNAVIHGHLEVTQWLVTNQRCDCIECLMETAVLHGHFAIVQWLEAFRAQQIASDQDESPNALPGRCHQHDRLRFMNYVSSWRLALDLSSHRDPLRSVQWICDHFPALRLHPGVLIFATESGHDQLVQWLWKQYRLVWSHQVLEEAFRTACAEGHLNIVKFLCGQHTSVSVSSKLLLSGVEKAAVNGHLKVVQFLVKESSSAPTIAGPPVAVNDTVLRSMLASGHVDVVRLLDSDFAARELADSSSDVLCNAVRQGQISLLNGLLREQHNDASLLPQLPLQSVQDALQSAIRNGQIEAVQLLFKTMQQMKGLRSGTVQHEDCGIEVAMNHVNRHVSDQSFVEIAWFLLRAKSTLWSENHDFAKVIDRAASIRDLALIKLLHARSAKGFSKSTMDRAASSGALPLVRFLHENRHEGCTKAAMDRAAGNGFLHVVRFLDENYREGCSSRALKDAACNGHIQVVRYLCANRGDRRRSLSPTKALHTAAAKGHLRLIDYLLHGVGSKQKTDVQVVLKASCENGQLHVVQWLIQHHKDSINLSQAMRLVEEVAVVNALTRMRQRQALEIVNGVMTTPMTKRHRGELDVSNTQNS